MLPQCLVLCNTRELATQITDEFQRFAKYLPKAKCCTLIGKVPINVQIKQLKQKDSPIVIGTLGRVADLVKRKELDLSNLQFLVIDEADNLFMNEDNKDSLAEIIAAKPRDTQTMIFSATFCEQAKKESEAVLREGFREITVDDNQLILHGLVQVYFELQEAEKLQKVIELLKLNYTQAVVFTSHISRAKVLAEYLNENGIDCKHFVGKMNNKEREDLYRQFKKKEFRVVVCTDIFQRGVDFEGVNMVIHFDMPQDTDSYLHRSGRAGRFETNGLVVSFVASDEDKKTLADIQERFAVKIEQVKSVEEIETDRAFLAK